MPYGVLPVTALNCHIDCPKYKSPKLCKEPAMANLLSTVPIPDLFSFLHEMSILSCFYLQDALLASIAEAEKQTELAARVSTWKQKIEQSLEEQVISLTPELYI